MAETRARNDGTEAGIRMRSVQVFIVCLVIGAVTAVLYARFFSPATPSPVESTNAAGPTQSPATTVAPAVAAPAVSTSSAVPRAAPPEPTDVENAQAKATRLAVKESYSRRQIQALLQTSMKGKLSDRELTPSEYDRLADAILRIRASQRVLEGIKESDPGSEVRGIYSDALNGAFAEIQEITGVPPSGWGDVLTAQEPTDNTGENVGRAQDTGPNMR